MRTPLIQGRDFQPIPMRATVALAWRQSECGSDPWENPDPLVVREEN